MVSIKELQKSIAREKARIKGMEEEKALIIEKSKLKKELFILKNPKPLPGKAERILRRGGKGIVSAFKKAAPIIKKQARLIRDQQLRDDAITRKFKQKKKVKKKEQKSPRNDFFSNLDF